MTQKKSCSHALRVTLMLLLCLCSFFTLTVRAFAEDSLQSVKDQAISNLKSYKSEESYDEFNRPLRDSEIASGRAAILAATDEEGVNAALAAAKGKIDLIPTVEKQKKEREATMELAILRANSLSDLAGYKSDVPYKEAQSEERLALISAGQEAIRAAKTKTEVSLALNNAKSSIDALKTDKTTRTLGFVYLGGGVVVIGGLVALLVILIIKKRGGGAKW